MEEMHEGLCYLPWVPDRNGGEYFDGVPKSWREEREEIEPKVDEQLLLVDMSKDLKEIISDVKKCYNSFHRLPDYQHQESTIRSSGNITRLPRDLPRAIGLWLWDYVDNKKFSWEHRAKAYAAFREKYQNPNNPELFIGGYPKDSQLGETLELANECIEKMEVLPGS